MATTAYTIKKFSVISIAKFFAVIGLIWGLLAGIILLASYIEGYISTGQASLIVTGLSGLGPMVLYGVIGGFIGGAIIALVYNRMLGSTHGVKMDLETR
jgi:hypothetical protein